MHLSEAISLFHNAAPELQHTTRWADLGCGSGFFTHVLAHYLSSGSTIFGIDLRPTLKAQTTPNGISLVPMKSNFVEYPLPIDNLDGILMANSLHYVEDQPAFLQQLRPHLRRTASLLLVEYDITVPVPNWVPYPVPFASLQPLLQNAGWAQIRKLGQRPSAYGRGNMYAALATPSTTTD